MAEPMTQALERLSAELIHSAETQYAVVIRRAMIVTAAHAPEMIRQSALDTLPRSGGANVWVADAVTKVMPTAGARSAGVTVRTRKSGHDLKSIDAGRLRHPTYGQPKPTKWGMTPVRPGFFSRPMRSQLTPEMTVAMRESMRVIAKGLTGGR